MSFKKIFFALFFILIIFFFVPVIIYGFFSKYFGMTPPFKIHTHELSYLISLQFFQAIVFFLAIGFIARLKKEKALNVSLLVSVFLFFLADFSPKMIHAFNFDYLSSLYLKVSLLIGAITYLIGGVILGKAFEEKKEGLYL